MKNLRLLFNKLITMLSKESPSHGYKTIIYPKPGQPIVINDTLDFGQTASVQQLDELSEFWRIEEISIDDLGTHAMCNLDFPNFEINPTTGLPMLNDAVDVAGNLYGISNTELDILSRP